MVYFDCMKKYAFFVILLSILPLFAKESMSDFENQLLEKTLQQELLTRSCDSNESAIQMLDDYILEIESPEIQNQLSDEVRLIIENLLVLSKYTYLYNIDMNSESAKELIMNQYEKVVEWNESHTDDLNKWYVVSYGDLINSCMRFLPQTQAIKLGLQEKKDYDALVEKYPEMSVACMNSALWYYFAPGIGGGSQKKAGELFNQAYSCASNDYEKYYSAVYLSQYYFNTDKTKCSEYLQAAENVLPGTSYINFIKMLNSKGYSVLDYSNNREKIDKKLGL